jgi:hypothetical protein
MLIRSFNDSIGNRACYLPPRGQRHNQILCEMFKLFTEVSFSCHEEAKGRT